MLIKNRTTYSADEILSGSLLPNCSKDAVCMEAQLNRRLINLHKRLMEKKDAKYFLEPVDCEEYPMYSFAILQPRDLGTIAENLKNNFYAFLDDYTTDVRLVFTNCRTFNEPDSTLFNCTVPLSEFFENELDRIVRMHSSSVEIPSEALVVTHGDILEHKSTTLILKGNTKLDAKEKDSARSILPNAVKLKFTRTAIEHDVGVNSLPLEPARKIRTKNGSAFDEEVLLGKNARVSTYITKSERSCRSKKISYDDTEDNEVDCKVMNTKLLPKSSTRSKGFNSEDDEYEYVRHSKRSSRSKASYCDNSDDNEDVYLPDHEPEEKVYSKRTSRCKVGSDLVEPIIGRLKRKHDNDDVGLVSTAPLVRKTRSTL